MSTATVRRSLLITVAVLIAAACAAPTAGATFPGRNGPIAFRTVDFETGSGNPLFRAQPDGTQVTQGTWTASVTLGAVRAGANARVPAQTVRHFAVV